MAKYVMRAGMGKHYARVDGKDVVLRPGDRIECEPYELGAATDKFEMLEPSPAKRSGPSVRLMTVMRPARTANPKGTDKVPRYDVVNPRTGKAINDVPLTHAEAVALAQTTEVGPDAEPEAG